MIDPNVKAIAEKRARHDLEDRMTAVAWEIAQVREDAGARGVGRGSGVQLAVSRVLAHEYRIRTQFIWHAFARAVDAAGVTLEGHDADDVKSWIRKLLLGTEADLLKHHEGMAALAGMLKPYGPTAAEMRDAALDRVWTEVDFAVLRHSAKADPSRSVVNVYQTFGIVQTGAGSQASMTINVGAAEKQEIETAMAAVENAIETGQLPARARQEATELVADVREELARDMPNGSRIRGALAGLAGTVQTLGAAPAAYQLLKGAAALVGLDLP